MNDSLKDRIIRRLEGLPDERGYQILDYVEFLESKYGSRAGSGFFTRLTETAEDTMRAVGLPIRAPRTRVALAPEALDRVCGAYELSPGFVLTIFRNGDALFAQATGQPRLPMAAVSPNQFVIPVANAELVFDISEAGPARHITLRQNGSMVTASRTPDATPTNDQSQSQEPSRGGGDGSRTQ